MDLVVGAKSTKPGSKANAKRGAAVTGRAARVPAGTLHLVDLSAQSTGTAMFDAVCGEGALVCVDQQWDEELPNDRCDVCADHMWRLSFNALQENLLK